MDRFPIFLLAALIALGGCGRPATDGPSRKAGGVPSGEGGYAAKAAFDPVAMNGPIFEGWPQPKLAIVVSGLLQGYLEPCGCAGLENQKGGVSRRHTFLQQRAAEGWPLVTVDLGSLIRRYGRQAGIKFQRSVEALRLMEYDAVALGPEDLRLPVDELYLAVAPSPDPGDEGQPNAFVAANVDILGLGLPRRFRLIERAGYTIGVVAVLGESYRKRVNSEEIEFSPAATALESVMPELEDAGCDFVLLLAQATRKEAAALATKFPGIDVMVVAEGADEPPHETQPIGDGKTLMVQIGHKGMYLGVIGLFDDPMPPRYQRVPLDSRFGESEVMVRLMGDYQQQLKVMGFEGLGLRPAVHQRGSGPGDPMAHFAGAASCQECHPTAYGIWSKSPHAHATETLVKLSPARQFDPECISCHATGWQPQEHYPFETGYEGLESTPLLVGNGCENCHGPGAAHVEAEKAKDFTHRDSLRAVMRLTSATAEPICRRCHDLDNSPAFDFNTYWSKIEHRGKR